MMMMMMIMINSGTLVETTQTCVFACGHPPTSAKEQPDLRVTEPKFKSLESFLRVVVLRSS